MKKNWDRDNFFNEEEENQLYNNINNDISIFDDDEIDNIKEQKMLETLDSDLLKYFNEAHVVKKKTITKKSKKEKIVYIIGDKIKVNNIIGTIIYGPYEKDNKIFYEIETADGIISIEDKGNIQKV